MNLLQTPASPSIVVATGPAGVAKTFISTAMGISKLKDGSIRKLIITRPAVAAGSDAIGFLPGTLEAKMDPFTRPIFDVFHKFASQKEVQAMIARQDIEICPLIYMRGRTFDNAWICADEMQNSTPEQMLMLLTRIGENSKLIINGDPTQHDRKYEVNGLADFLQRLDRSPCDEIALVNFTEEHVERHPVIKKIIHMYGPSKM
jgi:phosphate starvation-inducible PhoH-like protein